MERGGEGYSQIKRGKRYQREKRFARLAPCMGIPVEKGRT
jgi:hypothetical protein